MTRAVLPADPTIPVTLYDIALVALLVAQAVVLVVFLWRRSNRRDRR